MAPRKVKVIVKQPAAAAGEHVAELEPNDLELEQEEKLAEWRKEFHGAGYYIRVERWNLEQRKWEFLDTIDFDGWDLATLRKWVVGSSSRFRLRLLNSEKRYQEGGSFEQLVANPDWRDPASAPPAPPAPEDPTKSPLIQMMIEQNKSQQQTMSQLLVAIAGRPQGPDPLDMLVKLKQLMPDQKAPSMKEQAEVLIALKELMGDDSGGSESTWISEIKEGVSLFSQLTELAAKRRAAKVGAQPPASLQLPRTNPQPKEGAAVPKNEVVDVVSSYIPIFLRKAQAAADVEDTARFLIDEVDSDVIPALRRAYPILTEDLAYGQLVAGAKDPKRLEQIFAFAPALAPHREWVLQVIGKALELYDKDDQVEIS
jgi:hypothetical protein